MMNNKERKYHKLVLIIYCMYFIRTEISTIVQSLQHRSTECHIFSCWINSIFEIFAAETVLYVGKDLDSFS